MASTISPPPLTTIGMSSELDWQLTLLRQHAPKQTLSIVPLLNQPHIFCNSDHLEWNDLWRSVWGRRTGDVPISDKDDPVVRSSNPVDDSFILPDVVPHSRRVMTLPAVARRCWNFDFDAVLIRSEYNKAEEFALSQCHDVQALIITGQPGIGKSTFLFRILINRLRHELPTALQVLPNSAFLFSKFGVVEFSQLNRGSAYFDLQPKDGPDSRIWALVNSNRDLDGPSSVFRDGPFFVVEAEASFEHPARRDWTDYVPHKSFYMKPWTFAEVIQVRSLVNQHSSEQILFHMYNKYGASAGYLLGHANNPMNYERMVLSQVLELSPLDLEELFRDPTHTKRRVHFLISAHPSLIDPTKPESKVASQYIVDKICMEVLENQVDEVRKICEMLQDGGQMDATGRMFFKYRVHQFLREGRAVKIFPILSKTKGNKLEGNCYVYDDYTATDTGVPMSCLGLPKLEEKVIYAEETGTAEVGIYYRAAEGNFPSVDSWLHLRLDPQVPPTLLRFQMSLTETTYAVEKAGLDRVDGLISAEKKLLVVITEKGIQPKILVPVDCLAGKLDACSPDTVFPVFHLPLSKEELFANHP